MSEQAECWILTSVFVIPQPVQCYTMLLLQRLYCAMLYYRYTHSHLRRSNVPGQMHTRHACKIMKDSVQESRDTHLLYTYIVWPDTNGVKQCWWCMIKTGTVCPLSPPLPISLFHSPHRRWKQLTMCLIIKWDHVFSILNEYIMGKQFDYDGRWWIYYFVHLFYMKCIWIQTAFAQKWNS